MGSLSLRKMKQSSPLTKSFANKMASPNPEKKGSSAEYPSGSCSINSRLKYSEKWCSKYSIIWRFLYPTIKQSFESWGKLFFNFNKIWSIALFPATFRNALGFEKVNGCSLFGSYWRINIITKYYIKNLSLIFFTIQ